MENELDLSASSLHPKAFAVCGGACVGLPWTAIFQKPQHQNGPKLSSQRVAPPSTSFMSFPYSLKLSVQG